MFVEFIFIVIYPVVIGVDIALVLSGVVEHVPELRQFVELAADALGALQGLAVCALGDFLNAHAA